MCSVRMLGMAMIIKGKAKMTIGTPSVAMVTGSSTDEVRKTKLKEYLEAEKNGLMAEEYEEILKWL